MLNISSVTEERFRLTPEAKQGFLRQLKRAEAYINNLRSALEDVNCLGKIHGMNFFDSYEDLLSSLTIGLYFTHPESYLDLSKHSLDRVIRKLSERGIADSLNTEEKRELERERIKKEREALEAQHAPKDWEKVDEMFKPHEKAQKTYNKLGKFVPPNTDKKFEGLPVLGPYKYKDKYGGDCTYLGQFKEGKRHGFGTEVRL